MNVTLQVGQRCLSKIMPIMFNTILREAYDVVMHLGVLATSAAL